MSTDRWIPAAAAAAAFTRLIQRAQLYSVHVYNVYGAPISLSKPLTEL